MIPQSIIDKIKDNTNIIDVFTDAGIKLVKKGTRYFCCCPHHNEKTPSCNVDPNTNLYYCYGCRKGGDSIYFLMEHEKYSYVDALKHLAKKYDIEIEEGRESPEQRMEYLHKTALYQINERVRDFYAELLQKTPRAKEYMDNRFGEQYVLENKFGFAPGRETLFHWAQKNSENIDNLLEVGLLGQSEEDNRIYDVFSNRVLFPIVDKNGHVIAFSGRTLSQDKKQQKYINSKFSVIYKKSDTVFGLFSAIRAGRTQGFFYCVEGGPDVARMQSVGIYNTIASLGGSWSKPQLEMVKNIVPKIIFINDADAKDEKTGNLRGIDIVINNSKLAMELGLEVSVRELLPLDTGEKVDPAEFFTSAEDLNRVDQLLPETNFVVWYAARIFKENLSTTERVKAIKDIAHCLALIRDEALQTVLLNEVNFKFVKSKQLLTDQVFAEKLVIRKDKSKKDEVDLLEYGFYVNKGGYMGNGQEWSNFTMKPLFHIRDEVDSRRLFSVKNNKGVVERIELNSEDLSSSTKFRQRMMSIGNFNWKGDTTALIKLTSYLIGNTTTAMLCKHVGYNQNCGYVFGNGIFTDEFNEADEDGIVKLGSRGSWYIPAASKRNIDSDEKYEREKRFVYVEKGKVTLEEYLKKFCVVFGNNGKIGMAYWMMTLFRDIVVMHTRRYPILNLYGPKGTGKSEMGAALMAFFGPGYKSPSIKNSTLSALTNDIGLYSNALWHADEYKNDLSTYMIEFLKGLYDGIGRTKMGGSSFDERTMTRVKAGIIISGQEMPTADIALFTRCIFLEFMNSKFTPAQTRNFNELFDINNGGLMYMSVEVLKHRMYFEAHFRECFHEVMGKIRAIPDMGFVETRIIECWCRLAATIKCLEKRIKLPFTYEEYEELTINGILNQNKHCANQDELASFWQVVPYLLDSAFIAAECDFKIQMARELKTEEFSTRIFSKPTRLLYLNKTTIFSTYSKHLRQTGGKQIDLGSLVSYLENCPQFLGHKKSMRFKWIVQGVPKTEIKDGHVVPIYNVRRAMVFNYDELVEQYGMQLDSNNQEEVPDQSQPTVEREGELEF